MDPDLLDNNTSPVAVTKDVLIETKYVRDAMNALRDLTSFIDTFEPFNIKMPLVQKSINQIISGGRTLGHLLNLTDWANNLKGTNDTDKIAISELVHELRAAFQSLSKPDLGPLDLPLIPDPHKFAITQGSTCALNDKAISVQIEHDNDYLIITICSLLEFNETGALDARGILDSNPNAITLDMDGSFDLYGALTFGTKITVKKSPLEVTVALDPIITQLDLASDLAARLGLGLIDLDFTGDVDLGGNASLSYCPSPCGANLTGLTQVSENSSFYYQSTVGYDLEGGIEISCK